MTNQQYQEPFLAIVIDPHRTMAAGKVEIGAFRTYPEVHLPPSVPLEPLFNQIQLSLCACKEIRVAADPLAAGCVFCTPRNGLQGYKPPDEPVSEYQTIPLNKIEDFGVHAKSYYPLDISYFKSSLDSHMLDLLWNKYWVNTLSASPLIGNRDFLVGQIQDLGEPFHINCLSPLCMLIGFPQPFVMVFSEHSAAHDQVRSWSRPTQPWRTAGAWVASCRRLTKRQTRAS